MMAKSPIVTHTAVGTSVTQSSHPHPHPQSHPQSQLHLGVSLSSAERPAALASTDT